MELGLDKLTPRQKQVYGGLLLVALLYGYWSYLLQPLYDNSQTLKRELERKELELSRVRALAHQEKKLTAELKVLERQLQIAKQILPTQKEMEVLLDNLSKQAEASGIFIDQFNPMPEQDHNEYFEVPITMTGRGTYLALGSFLGRLTALPRLVKTLKVDIQRHPRPSRDQTIQFTLQLATYRVGLE